MIIKIAIKTTLITSIAISTLLWGNVISYSDNNNEYSNDSKSVFTAGWLNAAKSKAEAVVAQNTQPKKSMLQNIMEYLQGKTQNNVEQNAADKPKPVLQQKQSSGGGSKRAATAATVIATAQSSTEIPAYIQSKVRDYLDKSGVTSTTTYQIRYTNGKYYAVWNSDPNTISAQVFDSSGNAASSPPTSIGGGSAVNINNITALSNGDIAVFWTETDPNTGHGYSTNYQEIDQYGNISAPVNLTGDNSGLNGAYLEKVATFANGSITLIWNIGGDASSDGSFYYQEIGQNGNVSSPVSLNTGFVYRHNFTTLANGNIAVFLAGSDSDMIDENWNLTTYQEIDQNGNISAPVSLTGNSGLAICSIDNVTTLANGNIAVFWDGYDSKYNWSTYYQEIGQDGNVSAPADLIANGYSGGNISNVITLANGNLGVFLTRYGSGESTFIYYQEIGRDGNVSAPVNLTPNDGITSDFSIANVTTLANGNFGVFLTGWENYRSSFIYYQEISRDGNVSAPVNLTPNGDSWISNITQLANGNIALFWEGGDSKHIYSLNYQEIAQGGNISSPVILTTPSWSYYGTNVDSVATLANGNIVVFWSRGCYGDRSINYQEIGQDGNIFAPVSLIGGNTGLHDARIDSVNTLANGNIAVFLNTTDSNYNYSLQTKVIDSSGNFASPDILTPPAPIVSLTALGNSVLNNPNIDPFKLDMPNDQPISGPSSQRSLTENSNTPAILRDLLTGQTQNMAGQSNPQMVEKGSLDRYALSLPQGQIPQADMEIAMRLASILSNPTDDQKALIDVIKSLLADTDKVKEGAANANPALVKAQNDLLQAVANILLAQGIPDLLKQGDMSNIKGIFSELDTQKNKIMREYVTSTKPYYNNTLKDLAKNIAVLQLKNILKPGTTQEELDKLPPSELDKILEKIKKEENRTFEEEYILQQEAKYRKEYLDPNKKKLEDNMKTMLNDFTSKINDVLKNAEKK